MAILRIIVGLSSLLAVNAFLLPDCVWDSDYWDILEDNSQSRRYRRFLWDDSDVCDWMCDPDLLPHEICNTCCRRPVTPRPPSSQSQPGGQSSQNTNARPAASPQPPLQTVTQQTYPQVNTQDQVPGLQSWTPSQPNQNWQQSPQPENQNRQQPQLPQHENWQQAIPPQNQNWQQSPQNQNWQQPLQPQNQNWQQPLRPQNQNWQQSPQNQNWRQPLQPQNQNWQQSPQPQNQNWQQSLQPPSQNWQQPLQPQNHNWQQLPQPQNQNWQQSPQLPDQNWNSQSQNSGTQVPGAAPLNNEPLHVEVPINLTGLFQAQVPSRLTTIFQNQPGVPAQRQPNNVYPSVPQPPTNGASVTGNSMNGITQPQSQQSGMLPGQPQPPTNGAPGTGNAMNGIFQPQNQPSGMLPALMGQPQPPTNGAPGNGIGMNAITQPQNQPSGMLPGQPQPMGLTPPGVSQQPQQTEASQQFVTAGQQNIQPDLQPQNQSPPAAQPEGDSVTDNPNGGDRSNNNDGVGNDT